MIQERASRLINLREFQSAGVPVDLGRLDLSPPEGEQYILRMVIRAADLAHIPDELDWVWPMIELAQEHQKSIKANHPFVYVTVRHGIVKSKSDDEWHVDGFSTRIPHVPEQNYVWSDRDGTEYADLQVTFPDDFNPRVHNVNHYLEKHVQEVLKANTHTVYCMDPYHLHRRPSSTTGTQRTFVRLSFVPIEINDVNNTQNPVIPRHYDQDGVGLREKLLTY